MKLKHSASQKNKQRQDFFNFFLGDVIFPRHSLSLSGLALCRLTETLFFFRAMSMQVVGCQEDATKLLVLTFQSQTPHRKCSSTDPSPCHCQKM